jgi:hypothetical protein
MHIKADFSGLEVALQTIGGTKASIGGIRNARAITNPIELQIQQQGSVVLSGAELAQHLSNAAGLLSIGETQITLHIYDPFENEESLSEAPARQTRFHFTECKTIENMRDKGRGNRYVSSARHDGLFEVRPYDSITKVRGEKMEAYLQPCHFCMTALNYENYSEMKAKADRAEALSEFDLQKFFEDFKSIFRCLPIYTSDTFPQGDYPVNWARVSWETRSKAGWVCSCCGVNCSEKTGLLHTHHRDGNRGNIRPSNLEVLCLACHKARPFHASMHYSSSNRMRLENLRIAQKMPRMCSKCKI